MESMGVALQACHQLLWNVLNQYSCPGWKSCSNWQITQYYYFTDDGDSSVCVSVLVCHTFSYYHCCNQVVILLHSDKVFSGVDPHSAWGCLQVKVPELLVWYSGFLIMVVSTSISMSDGLESYKTCKILNHQICVAGRIGCSFGHHLNLHNLQAPASWYHLSTLLFIKLTPYRHPGTAVVEWATGSSSMYNLLQELGSLNNVYCKDCHSM